MFLFPNELFKNNHSKSTLKSSGHLYLTQGRLHYPSAAECENEIVCASRSWEQKESESENEIAGLCSNQRKKVKVQNRRKVRKITIAATSNALELVFCPVHKHTKL